VGSLSHSLYDGCYSLGSTARRYGFWSFCQKEARLYSPRIAIAFAACVMLFINPELLRFDIGFLFSFLATAVFSLSIRAWKRRQKIGQSFGH